MGVPETGKVKKRRAEPNPTPNQGYFFPPIMGGKRIFGDYFPPIMRDPGGKNSCFLPPIFETLGGKSRVFSPLMGGKKSAAGGKF